MTATPGKRFKMPAVKREGLATGVYEVVSVSDFGVKLKADGCYPPGGFTVGITAWRELWLPKAVEVAT